MGRWDKPTMDMPGDPFRRTTLDDLQCLPFLIHPLGGFCVRKWQVWTAFSAEGLTCRWVTLHSIGNSMHSIHNVSRSQSRADDDQSGEGSSWGRCNFCESRCCSNGRSLTCTWYHAATQPVIIASNTSCILHGNGCCQLKRRLNIRLTNVADDLVSRSMNVPDPSAELVLQDCPYTADAGLELWEAIKSWNKE